MYGTNLEFSSSGQHSTLAPTNYLMKWTHSGNYQSHPFPVTFILFKLFGKTLQICQIWQISLSWKVDRLHNLFLSEITKDSRVFPKQHRCDIAGILYKTDIEGFLKSFSKNTVVSSGNWTHNTDHHWLRSLTPLSVGHLDCVLWPKDVMKTFGLFHWWLLRAMHVVDGLFFCHIFDSLMSSGHTCEFTCGRYWNMKVIFTCERWKGHSHVEVVYVWRGYLPHVKEMSRQIEILHSLIFSKFISLNCFFHL